MTLEQKLNLVQMIVMAAATLVLWSLRGAFFGGKFVSDFESALKEIRSDLARLSQDIDQCLTRREAQLITEESKADRQRIRESIKELWSVVNAMRHHGR